MIGRRPSCEAVVGFKLANGVLHYLLADVLRDHDPDAARMFQIVSLVVQGGVVAANMRVVF